MFSFGFLILHFHNKIRFEVPLSSEKVVFKNGQCVSDSSAFEI